MGKDPNISFGSKGNPAGGVPARKDAPSLPAKAAPAAANSGSSFGPSPKLGAWLLPGGQPTPAPATSDPFDCDSGLNLTCGPGTVYGQHLQFKQLTADFDAFDGGHRDGSRHHEPDPRSPGHGEGRNHSRSGRRWRGSTRGRGGPARGERRSSQLRSTHADPWDGRGRARCRERSAPWRLHRRSLPSIADPSRTITVSLTSGRSTTFPAMSHAGRQLPPSR